MQKVPLAMRSLRYDMDFFCIPRQPRQVVSALVLCGNDASAPSQTPEILAQIPHARPGLRREIVAKNENALHSVSLI